MRKNFEGSVFRGEVFLRHYGGVGESRCLRGTQELEQKPACLSFVIQDVTLSSSSSSLLSLLLQALIRALVTCKWTYLAFKQKFHLLFFRAAPHWILFECTSSQKFQLNRTCKFCDKHQARLSPFSIKPWPSLKKWKEDRKNADLLSLYACNNQQKLKPLPKQTRILIGFQKMQSSLSSLVPKKDKLEISFNKSRPDDF